MGEMWNWISGKAKKTVITWHSDIVRQRTLLRLYAPILRRVIAKADCIIPTSEIYARTSPWLRDHLDKCSVVPLGVDVNRFLGRYADEQSGRHGELRSQLISPLHSFSSSPFLLLSVGRLRYYKGLDRLIRVMPRLPNCIFVVAGNGPMEAEWRALARQLGVADRVQFIGSPSDADLPAIYRAADVYVLPATSRAEAFGVAILEAMASELPVVCTNVGTATAWINQDGVTGFVTPPDDNDALGVAIEKLHDASLRELMGAAARERVLAEFTQERMIERVEDMYRTMLAA
jgi:rhamnosyl/mannosyltransferase